MDSKKKRFQEELKRIQQLSAINKVLKKGDVENAFLNNTDKESEVSKDTAVERMLEGLQSGKGDRKDMELLDSLVKDETMPKRQSRPGPLKRQKASSSRKAAPKRAKSSRRKR